MNTGWKCPECGKCLAPTVRECDHGGVGRIVPTDTTRPAYIQPATGDPILSLPPTTCLEGPRAEFRLSR